MHIVQAVEIVVVAVAYAVVVKIHHACVHVNHIDVKNVENAKCMQMVELRNLHLDVCVATVDIIIKKRHQ
jgi:hypothetical protein